MTFSYIHIIILSLKLTLYYNFLSTNFNFLLLYITKYTNHQCVIWLIFPEVNPSGEPPCRTERRISSTLWRSPTNFSLNSLNYPALNDRFPDFSTTSALPFFFFNSKVLLLLLLRPTHWPHFYFLNYKPEEWNHIFHFFESLLWLNTVVYRDKFNKLITTNLNI